MSEVRVPAWSGAGESSLPGSQKAALLCARRAFTGCVRIRKKRALSLFFL